MAVDQQGAVRRPTAVRGGEEGAPEKELATGTESTRIRGVADPHPQLSTLTVSAPQEASQARGRHPRAAAGNKPLVLRTPISSMVKECLSLRADRDIGEFQMLKDPISKHHAYRSLEGLNVHLGTTSVSPFE
jgi:hypothetical protein